MARSIANFWYWGYQSWYIPSNLHICSLSTFNPLLPFDFIIKCSMHFYWDIIEKTPNITIQIVLTRNPVFINKNHHYTHLVRFLLSTHFLKIYFKVTLSSTDIRFAMFLFISFIVFIHVEYNYYGLFFSFLTYPHRKDLSNLKSVHQSWWVHPFTLRSGDTSSNAT